MNTYKLDTKMIHAGIVPDALTGAIMTPIYQTSTFVQVCPGQPQDYNYSRSANPTRKALEDALASLENGTQALAFSSGVAAIDAVIRLLESGDEVIASDKIYGGSYRLFTTIYQKFGIRFHFVNLNDPDEVNAHISPATKLIWAESPSNPLLTITDLVALSILAKKNNLLLCVDNTFASPYLQNPIDFGADIIVHSATKYLGGHSDVLLGALVLKEEELYKKLHTIQNSCGAVPGPQDCFLVLRGIKTLHLRMQRHCENTEKIARFLRQHPLVEKVFWCGFEDHPCFELAKRQMRGFGGVVSFTLAEADVQKVFRFLSLVKLFSVAEGLGGVESLINHPATMSHSSLPAEQKLKIGIADNLIRLSVGVEHADDLIQDLSLAFEQL